MIELETAEVQQDNFLQCSEASTKQTENQGKEVLLNYSPKPSQLQRLLLQDALRCCCPSAEYCICQPRKKVKLALPLSTPSLSPDPPRRKTSVSNCLSHHSPSLDTTFTPLCHPSAQEPPLDDFILAPPLPSPSPLQQEYSRLAALHHLVLLQPCQLASLESPSSRLAVKCKCGHRCSLSLEELSQGCSRCASIFDRCLSTVKALGGHIKDQRFSPVLNVQCALGHEFLINYKSLALKWCSICRKMKESTAKVQEQQRRQRLEEENEKRQEKMFQESRQRLGQPEEKPAMEVDQQAQVLYAFRLTEKATEELASSHARQSEDFQEAFYVYKVLLLAEDILTLYFRALDKNELKLEYKRYARHLHPDKNRHPKSGLAFRKLKRVYKNTV